MNSTRIGSRLVFTIVLFGILSTHFISAQDETSTVENLEGVAGTTAAQGQSAPQESSAPGVLETATSGGQEVSVSAAGDGDDSRSTAAESITAGAGDAATGTAAGSVQGDAAVAATGATAGESSPQGAGVGETTAGDSSPQGAGVGETTAGDSSPQGAGVGETTTSAGELGTASTERGQVIAGAEETRASPPESSTRGAEVRETASTAEELSTGRTGGGTSTPSVQEYTTGRPETDETSASVQKTAETAEHTTSSGQTVTSGQTAAAVPGHETEKVLHLTTAQTTTEKDPCEKWPTLRVKTRNNETFNCTLTACEVNQESKTKKYKYSITLVIIQVSNNESMNLPWTVERNTPLKYNRTIVSKQLRDVFKKLLPKPSGKRIRRQSDDDIKIEENNDDEGFTLIVPEDLTLQQIAGVYNETIRLITEEPSTQAITTSPASDTTATTKTDVQKPGQVSAAPAPAKQGIWEAHFGLFLTVIILIAVCIVVTGVCCLCMKWRGRGRERQPDKQPMAVEEARSAPTSVSNPIPDAEMIQDEAPMQERENPAVTPNGGGQHISKADEDNGWVVPLDELSKAEKEKPEVENTRL